MMAKIVFGMMQSLDGFVAGVHGELDPPLHAPPGPKLFRYWIEYVRRLSASVYGRRMYDVMRYWDEDRPDWEDAEHEFASVWRAQPKWVVSRSRPEVGPNARLVDGDLGAFIRDLRHRVPGFVDVAGPELAGALSDLRLIDEYQLYYRPYFLGRGKPYFAGKPPSALELVGVDRVGEDTLRATYAVV